MKKHNERVSVKKDSFFHDSNLTLEESVKITYWWSVGMSVQQVCEGYVAWSKVVLTQDRE